MDSAIMNISSILEAVHNYLITFCQKYVNLFLREMCMYVEYAIFEWRNKLRLCIWHLSIQGYDGMLHDICS